MAAMEQIILFGDSLTQFSGDQSSGFAFKAALENGVGYNTNLCLRVLPHIISPPSVGRIRLFVIFLGANDARLAGTPPIDQCVSLPEYVDNLKSILDHEKIAAHKPRFLLITPPPIDERLCEVTDREKGFPMSRRSAAHTAAYAQAVGQLGRERSIPVVDLWSAFLKASGYDTVWDGKAELPGSKNLEVNEKLRQLLSDGLHFTAQAYKVMFEEVMETIKAEMPELSPENLHMVFPEWKDEDAWQSFNGPRRA
ncbi:GDSL-like Lipase/Acylhydrolase-like protein 1 [Elsinoe fawcettii]|nr:GDSL-like Lipase/Acylhydrolase-like protein 1 [Elsinoe fawcettii]